MDTALAFINSKNNIPLVVEMAGNKGVKSLTIISETHMTCPNLSGPVIVDIDNIFSYAMEDLDQYVMATIYKKHKQWLMQNIRIHNLLKNYGLTEGLDSLFSSLSFQWFRRALIITRIVAQHKPDMIIADEYWRKYCELAAIKFLNIFEKDKHWRLMDKMKRYVLQYIWGLTSLTYKIIIPIILGNILNAKNRRNLYRSQIILLGSTHSNKGFYPLWHSIERKSSNTSELFYDKIFDKAAINPYSRILHSRNKGLAEGIISISDIPGLIVKYLRLYFAYRRDTIDKHLLEQTVASEYFGMKIDRSLLISMGGMIVFSRLGESMGNFKSLKRVFLSFVDPYCISLSVKLREKRIETVSSTHGMVLEPIAYRSFDSVKITWGSFDSKLLKDYSHDITYLPLISTPAGLIHNNATNGTKSWLINNLKAFPEKGCTEVWHENQNRDCAVIFPSTNYQGENLFRFLSIALNHLMQNQEKYLFDYIVIKIKKSPRSNIQEYIEDIRRIMEGHLKSKIILCDEVNISELLAHCTFSLCTHSSILLDLLRCNVPFSVYVFDTLSNRKFINMLPSWMRFTCASDLDKITPEDIMQFSKMSNGYKKLYWGENEGYDIEGLVKRFDIV